MSRRPIFDAWKAELNARRRTTTTFDGLWRAACAEAAALEAEADGLPASATRRLHVAAAILRSAATAEAA